MKKGKCAIVALSCTTRRMQIADMQRGGGGRKAMLGNLECKSLFTLIVLLESSEYGGDLRKTWNTVKSQTPKLP